VPPLESTARSLKWLVRAADAGLRGALEALHSLVASVDATDLHHHDHSDNVARYAVALGRALGLDAERLAKLQRAAFLHDVGKAGIDPAILSKPGALDAAELHVIRTHPATGAAMLATAGLHEESRWVRSHHERADGHGYPDGLVGAEIPLEARIIMVVDSFEAMTSDRPYRRGVSVEIALAELRYGSGAQFDPDVAGAFRRLVGSGALNVQAVRSTGPPLAAARA